MIEKLKMHKVLKEWFPPNPVRSGEEEEEHALARVGLLPELTHTVIMINKLNEVIDKLNETENPE